MIIKIFVFGFNKTGTKSLQAALDSGSAPAALTQDLISQAGYELIDDDNEYIDWRDEVAMWG